MKFYLRMVAVLLLAGCAASGVVATSDPEQKLRDARQLLSSGRPYPAERLMREAMDGFDSRRDYRGLGGAQLEYASFLRSPAFRDWPLFRKMYPTLVTNDDIDKESMRYVGEAAGSLEKAVQSLASTNDYWGLSSSYFLLARARAQLHELSISCPAYRQSLEYHKKARMLEPGKNYYILPGYKDFDEMIAGERKKIGCPE